jgi:hypothetical protein
MAYLIKDEEGYLRLQRDDLGEAYGTLDRLRSALKASKFKRLLWVEDPQGNIPLPPLRMLRV